MVVSVVLGCLEFFYVVFKLFQFFWDCLRFQGFVVQQILELVQVVVGSVTWFKLFWALRMLKFPNCFFGCFSYLSLLCWVVSQVVLHAFFFLSLLACLRFICNCGMCCVFWVILRFSWLFHDIFGELCQLVFICFNFLNVVSGCANCSLFEISLWFVTHCFIFFFGEFRVVWGGVRWFLVLWRARGDERTIRRSLASVRHNSTTTSLPWYPCNAVLSGSSCQGCLKVVPSVQVATVFQ